MLRLAVSQILFNYSSMQLFCYWMSVHLDLVWGRCQQDSQCEAIFWQFFKKYFFLFLLLGMTREPLLMHNGKSGVMTSINALADRPRVQHIFILLFYQWFRHCMFVCINCISSVLAFSFFSLQDKFVVSELRNSCEQVHKVLCSSILFLPTRFQASSITWYNVIYKSPK